MSLEKPHRLSNDEFLWEQEFVCQNSTLPTAKKRKIRVGTVIAAVFWGSILAAAAFGGWSIAELVRNVVR